MKQKFTKQFKISILRPGGNDTALIEGIVEKERRKFINDRVMKMFPNVEQVGFYKYDTKNRTAQLEMAGGEFCGNATRALTYLLLKGKKGEISISVSGTNKILKAGIKKKNTAYAEIPIVNDFTSIIRINKDLYKVKLEGITHLILLGTKSRGPLELKIRSKKLLGEMGLLYSEPASGVISLYERGNNNFFIKPVVWVKDIQTLFYETACASGSAAVGLWNSLKNNAQISTIKVKQPSNEYIQVIVRKNEKKFLGVFVDGKVLILKRKGELTL